MNTSRIRLGGLAVGLLVLAIATVALAGQGLPIAEAYDRGPFGTGGPADSGPTFDNGPEKTKVQGLIVEYHDFGLGSSVSVQLVKDTKKGELVDGASVADGGTITVRAISGQKSLGSKVELLLNGSTKISIHTSCSKPIDIGFVYADGKDAAEAESMSTFNSTGFSAALEIVSLEPVGACDSFVPPPPPEPEPETETPTAALPEAAAPTPTPTPVALGVSALPEGGGLPPEGGGSLLPLLYILSGATAIVVVAATARRWSLSNTTTGVIGTRGGRDAGWTWMRPEPEDRPYRRR